MSCSQIAVAVGVGQDPVDGALADLETSGQLDYRSTVSASRFQDLLVSVCSALPVESAWVVVLADGQRALQAQS